MSEYQEPLSTVSDIIAEERRKKIALAAKKSKENAALNDETANTETKTRRKRRWFRKPKDMSEEVTTAQPLAKRRGRPPGRPKQTFSARPTSLGYDEWKARIDQERDDKVKALDLLFGVNQRG